MFWQSTNDYFSTHGQCPGKKALHLQLVYDKIYANVRTLEVLGVKVEEYGSFLIPVILTKLPNEVRLQIA